MQKNKAQKAAFLLYIQECQRPILLLFRALHLSGPKNHAQISTHIWSWFSLARGCWVRERKEKIMIVCIPRNVRGKEAGGFIGEAFKSGLKRTCIEECACVCVCIVSFTHTQWRWTFKFFPRFTHTNGDVATSESTCLIYYPRAQSPARSAGFCCKYYIRFSQRTPWRLEGVNTSLCVMNCMYSSSHQRNFQFLCLFYFNNKNF